MAKLILIICILISSRPIYALEKCTFKLDPKFFKVGLNFYTDDERLEQKGYFSDVEIKGKLFGNSIRDIIKNLEIFIPYKNLNTYNTARDRMIYNYLLENETDKQEFARVQIKKLHPKKIHLNISINNISKDIVFKYDSRDVSMQSIGYIDLKDFNLIKLKDSIEQKYDQKIWNDIFFDIRAKFDKKCINEL